MQTVIAVCRAIILCIRLIVWALLLPLIIIIAVGKMILSRFSFRSQLIKSGISKEWADKLSKRYMIRFKDISDMIKLSRNKQLKFTD